tara:strand:- start:1182 stop:3938 length:2757 start_codon:yes stop_codon:yes gene_type:complete
MAQEHPPIQIYAPKDYGGETQNWSISQSKEKYIYVANNQGLLEFNGANWQLYKSPNETIVRSVKVIDGIIYTGCNSEFGYWKRNGLGLLYYTSLSEELKIEFLEDEEFWNIINIDDYILFQSLQRIYIFNKINKSYNIIDSETTIHKMFKVDDAIYFQRDKEGLYKIENGTSKVVSRDPVIKGNVLVNVFDYNNSLLIETESNGFYILENDKLVRWEAPINDILSNYNVYRSTRLNDNSFVLGTTSNGILHITPDGKLKSHINRIHGLSNNTIHNIFEDAENNIWLALNNGINSINFNSPFSIYKDKKGQLGTVHASAVFDNNLYLGTNQGLFYKPLNTAFEFKFIEGTQGAVWSLTQIDDTLFCGHNSGTFIVSNDKATKIVDVLGTWNIKEINKEKDRLLQGNYDGLYVLEKVNNNWILRNKLEGFNFSSRFFEIYDDNQILVSHEYRGLFNLKVDSDYTKVLEVEKKNTSSDGKELYSSLVRYNNDILFSSKNGVFIQDRLSKQFIKDSLLSTLFTKEEYTSGKLVFNKETNTLWGFSKNNLNYISPGKLSKTPIIEKIPFSEALDLGLTGYENVTYIKDNEFLLGTSTGYIIIDLNKRGTKNYNISINAIEKRIISKEPEIVNKNIKGLFKNKYKNIKFSYSVAEFQKYLDTEYQYHLEGLYPEWSSWTTNSTASFENLPHGDYTFKVKARVGNNLTKNIETYSFSIERPWYLVNAMIITYIVLILLFSLFMHNIYKSYYRKQREKLLQKTMRELELKELENKQQFMRFNNEKLRQDIENKNKELGISTMSLIKKNEFLNSLKKELQNVEDANNLKKVIKIIDRNLNNNDDWHVFEEAFNNADKDFLKKIKVLHPALTSNDLRLCAYLRLNLSSKEIAPLLNISPRSVEVKRYRLRKKMNLAHESSLSDYILEI